MIAMTGHSQFGGGVQRPNQSYKIRRKRQSKWLHFIVLLLKAEMGIEPHTLWLMDSMVSLLNLRR